MVQQLLKFSTFLFNRLICKELQLSLAGGIVSVKTILPQNCGNISVNTSRLILCVILKIGESRIFHGYLK